MKIISKVDRGKILKLTMNEKIKMLQKNSEKKINANFERFLKNHFLKRGNFSIEMWRHLLMEILNFIGYF